MQKSMDCDEGTEMNAGEGWWADVKKIKRKKKVEEIGVNKEMALCMRVKVREFAAISINFIWF